MTVRQRYFYSNKKRQRHLSLTKQATGVFVNNQATSKTPFEGLISTTINEIMFLFGIERIKKAKLRQYLTRSRKANNLKISYSKFMQNLAVVITSLLSYFPQLYTTQNDGTKGAMHQSFNTNVSGKFRQKSALESTGFQKDL